MSSKKKVYVVPHSHWDREWYFTIEDSNVLLSHNMQYLMDVLEKDENYNSYTFDAQLSVVEEFLKLYPDEKVRLEKLIADKRIFVGPWYTQTDTLLVNKESIIRNLLYGTRLGENCGHYMKVGYLPDIFGQNQYLPSILKGFEIDDAVLQRGLYTEELKGNLNFKWKSPDGKEVKANNIYLGYGPGKFLASDNEYMEEKLIPMLEKLESLNKDTKNLLLPAGGDQVLVRDHFPKTIKELNEKQSKYEFVLSDYETFMKDTWEENFENEISGELIASQKSRIHNSIKSQRYDIKKLNYDVENKLLYILEPLAVIGKSLGLRYDAPWINIMWKLLFDAHAHDSIGGCNSDETNKDIIGRLEKVDKICLNLINIIKKQITNSVSETMKKTNISLIFNTKVQSLEENIESVIFTKEKSFKLEDIEGNNIKFDVVNIEYISGGKQVVVTAEGEKQIELPGYYRSEIIIGNIKLPAMGYKVLVINNEESQIKVNSNSEVNYIENNLYKIEIDNKNISLINKETGEKIDNLLCFENTADHGDSYDYSPLDEDCSVIIDEVTVEDITVLENLQKITISHKVKLPASLEEREAKVKSTELEIKTTLQLRRSDKFVRVLTEIDNKINDHRVRVILNTNVISKTSLSDQGFSFIERNNKNHHIDTWKENGFAEAPVGIYAIENIVALKDDNNTFGVITKGIKEYEVLEDSKIALTLYRSVGLLGRDDLAWRPGRASGINNKVVYTPDAQMHKKMNFEYAISFDKCNEVNLFNIMDEFVERYTSYQKQSLNLFEERLERFEIPLSLENANVEYSLLTIDNKNVFQSVLKESYEQDAIILRLFNPGSKIEVVNIKSMYAKKIILTNLYERELEECIGEIEIEPKGYVTIKLVL